MIEIEAPDGTIVEFPAGTPDDVILRVMRQNYGGPQAQATPAAAPAAPVSGANLMAPAGASPEDLSNLLNPSNRMSAEEMALPFNSATPSRFLEGDVGGNLLRGSQAAVEGLLGIPNLPVDLASIPVNLGIVGTNALFGTEIPAVTEPLGGSALTRRDIRGGLESLFPGYEADPEEMPYGQRLAFEAQRVGTEAGGLGAQLARFAGQRAIERVAAPTAAPRAADPLLQPYSQAPTTMAARDAAGGAGAGTMLEAYREVDGRPEPGSLGDVLAQTGLGLLGGVAGAGGAAGVEAAARTGARLVRPTIDRSIPVPSDRWQGYRASSADEAARIVQGARTYDDAAARMDQNIAELAPVLDRSGMPTPAMLSEDPGLATLERQTSSRIPNELTRSRQTTNAAIRDTIDRAVPEGADPAALQGTAARRLDEQRARVDERERLTVETAQRDVDRATGQQTGIDMARREAAAESPVPPSAGAGREQQIRASQTLDEQIVDRTYLPLRAEKNERFRAAIEPVARNEVDAAAPIATAERVLERVNALAAPQRDAFSSELISNLNRLAPRMEVQPSSVLGPDGRPVQREVNVGGTGRARIGDLAGVRGGLRDAEQLARRQGNTQLADDIRELRRSVNDTLETVPELAEANRFYREEFAEVFRPTAGDPMADFTRRLDRSENIRDAEGNVVGVDRPRGLEPSQTAGRFLFQSAPERAASLRRVMDAMDDPTQAQQAAKDYLYGSMAQAGVLDRTGVLRPRELRAWRDSWAPVLEEMGAAAPGLRREVDDLVRRAERGERLAGEAADAVKRAEQDFVRRAREAGRDAAQARAELDKGALAAVANADPDRLVAGIMGAENTSRRRMQELVDLTQGNEAARNGLKAAVRDYILSKTETTATQNLPPGDRRGPISSANIRKLFDRHEDVLASVFSPEEMNILRAGQRALELSNVERLRLSSGSDTAQKLGEAAVNQFLQTPLGKGTEAFLRLKYGMLQGGGIVATARRAFSGLTTRTADEALELVDRAILDPDLMRILLQRDLPADSPAFRAAVQRYVLGSEVAPAIGEFARPEE